MSDQDVQRQVTQWKKENYKPLDETDPHICCTVFKGGERRVSDCEKRRGENEIYHSVYIDGEGVKRVVKAKFSSCMGCVVWKSLPKQTVFKHPLKVRTKRRK